MTSCDNSAAESGARDVLFRWCILANTGQNVAAVYSQQFWQILPDFDQFCTRLQRNAVVNLLYG